MSDQAPVTEPDAGADVAITWGTTMIAAVVAAGTLLDLIVALSTPAGDSTTEQLMAHACRQILRREEALALREALRACSAVRVALNQHVERQTPSADHPPPA